MHFPLLSRHSGILYPDIFSQTFRESFARFATVYRVRARLWLETGKYERVDRLSRPLVLN